MSSWSKSTMKRASTAVAPSSVASTGLRSTSVISGKSVTSSETAWMMSARPWMSTPGAAADPVQDLGRADAVDHVERVLARDRREAERHVAQDLDEDAAEAERHDRAERRVLDRADEHLGALREHLLDLDAGDLRVGLVGLRVVGRSCRSPGGPRRPTSARRARRWPPSCGGCPARRSSPPPDSPSPRPGTPPRPRTWRAPRPAPGCRTRRRRAWPPARSGPRGRRRGPRRAPP